MTDPDFQSMTVKERTIYHLKWIVPTLDWHNEQSGIEQPDSPDLKDLKELQNFLEGE